MQWYEILIVVACVLFVGGVIAKKLWDKAHGKTGCDCGCGNGKNCPHCVKNPDRKTQR
ncbi:MAG: hypothetical protein J5993_05725 [Clostridia bacterium]|nr:hypothetical protein [Clostridia bacterium]